MASDDDDTRPPSGGVKVHRCRNCGEPGHNTRTCTAVGGGRHQPHRQPLPLEEVRDRTEHVDSEDERKYAERELEAAAAHRREQEERGDVDGHGDHGSTTPDLPQNANEYSPAAVDRFTAGADADIAQAEQSHGHASPAVDRFTAGADADIAQAEQSHGHASPGHIKAVHRAVIDANLAVSKALGAAAYDDVAPLTDHAKQCREMRTALEAKAAKALEAKAAMARAAAAEPVDLAHGIFTGVYMPTDEGGDFFVGLAIPSYKKRLESDGARVESFSGAAAEERAVIFAVTGAAALGQDRRVLRHAASLITALRDSDMNGATRHRDFISIAAHDRARELHQLGRYQLSLRSLKDSRPADAAAMAPRRTDTGADAAALASRRAATVSRIESRQPLTLPQGRHRHQRTPRHERSHARTHLDHGDSSSDAGGDSGSEAERKYKRKSDASRGKHTSAFRASTSRASPKGGARSGPKGEWPSFHMLDELTVEEAASGKLPDTLEDLVGTSPSIASSRSAALALALGSFDLTRAEHLGEIRTAAGQIKAIVHGDALIRLCARRETLIKATPGHFNTKPQAAASTTLCVKLVDSDDEESGAAKKKPEVANVVPHTPVTHRVLMETAERFAVLTRSVAPRLGDNVLQVVHFLMRLHDKTVRLGDKDQVHVIFKVITEAVHTYFSNAAIIADKVMGHGYADLGAYVPNPFDQNGVYLRGLIDDAIKSIDGAPSGDAHGGGNAASSAGSGDGAAAEVDASAAAGTKAAKKAAKKQRQVENWKEDQRLLNEDLYDAKGHAKVKGSLRCFSYHFYGKCDDGFEHGSENTGLAAENKCKYNHATLPAAAAERIAVRKAQRASGRQ